MSGVTGIAQHLAEVLRTEKGMAGFEFDKKTRELQRTVDGRVETIRLDVSKRGSRAYFFTFDCRVHHSDVEELLRKYIKDRHPQAATIWAYGLNFGRPPVPYKGISHWLFERPERVTVHLPQIKKTLQEAVLPFLKRFSSTKAIVKEGLANNPRDYQPVLGICVKEGDAVSAGKYLLKVGEASKNWVENHRPDFLAFYKALRKDFPKVIPDVKL